MIEPTPRGTRLDLMVCCAIVAMVVLAGCVRTYWQAAGYRHDDAIYLSTARALHEGQGYRLVDLPGSPPQTKYPPLYPTLLAGLWAIHPAFPDNLGLIKGATLGSAAAFLVLVYCYLTRFGYFGRATAGAGCLLAATAPYFVDYSTAVMSEMLFGILSVLLLWRLDALRLAPREGLVADLYTGLLLALPVLCRSIGLVFLPLGVLLLRNWGRPWLRPGVMAGLFILPWMAWTLRAALAQRSDPIEGYYTDYLGWWLSFGPPTLSRVVGFNALYISANTAMLPAEGIGTLLRMIGPMAVVLPMVFVGVIGLGEATGRLRHREALPVLMAGYLLVVLVWPWEPARFLLPFLPMLACFVLAGLGELFRPRLGGTTTNRLGIALVATCLTANIGDLAARSYFCHRFGNPAGDDGAAFGCWADYQGMINWLRDNTVETDTIASGADAMLGLYTRRKAFYPIVCSPLTYIYNMPFRMDEVEFERSLSSIRRHRPRYLALTVGFHGEKEFRAWVNHLLKAYPKHIKRVYVGDDPRFVIYQLSYPLGVTQ